MKLFSFRSKDNLDPLQATARDFASQISQRRRAANRHPNLHSMLFDLKPLDKRRARQRLISAIVLIIGAVVTLPLILDSSPKTITDDIVIQIPSKYELVPDNLSRRETLIAAGQTRAPSNANTSLNSVSSGSKPNIPTGNRYVAQLGALNNNRDAQNWVSHLKAIGVPAYLERQYKSDGREERILLFAGPFSDRSEAADAVTKIRRAVNLILRP
ncbi:SPOR domain-containing protein [Candidatus Vallotiella sp. (ex Adelges kitamiensis)]|uniref:SPOR domain-containing protein n=1 Tax=Candidatus Vallotiella sp. (ex Adelges kitamiensis) TaxID=2864217 RepID=UPI001CE2EA6D|nr:SPOR domain-containing protein [Candidatus Vallotia sp. (ex Adelges kitamiensis)]